MEELALGDSKTQLKYIAMTRADPVTLYENLMGLSIALVMGVEQYLRRFDTALALPLLVGLLEKYMTDNSAGDIMVMLLRSVSLILEHVPTSYDGAQEFHDALMKYAFKATHKGLCGEWTYRENDSDSLFEECLRTVRFVSKDDRTGTVIRHAFMGDLLTLCASEVSLLARQGLETLYMLCCKVVMPSEFGKPRQTNAFLALFKPKKKSSKSSGGKLEHGEDGGSDSAVVINVENVIAPFLHTLIEQYTSALPHMQEAWAPLEYAIKCLGTLMERALLCHRPTTACTLVAPELPRLLFRIIAILEQNVSLEAAVRKDRILFVESMLAIATRCHRSAMAEALLQPDAKKFLRSILEDSSGEITTLLDQPFPLGVMAARSTQRRDKDHITSIAAIRLLVLATPNVPPEAFGLKPKVVFPVHQWLWEDELRHSNRLVEEQCVALETSWVRLFKESAVVVHSRGLPSNLLSMTMARGFSGGFRNISRQFVPFVYHFVDESSVQPVIDITSEQINLNSRPPSFTATASSPPSHHKHGGSSSKDKDKDRAKGDGSSSSAASSSPTGDSRVVLNETAFAPASHMALAEEYFIPLCGYATHASGQMAKQLATCACASILQLVFLTGAAARAETLMAKAMLPLCGMFVAALGSADKATKAVVLTMIEWVLRHPMAASWGVCETAQRSGLLSLLDEAAKVTPVVSVTRDSKPTRTADLADRSGALVGEMTARLRRRLSGGAAAAAACGDGSSFQPEAARLLKATEALRKAAKETGVQEKALKEFLDSLRSSGTVTAFEVRKMELAGAALSYLLRGTAPEDLFGAAFVFTAGTSDSTTSRVVQSVDISSTFDSTEGGGPPTASAPTMAPDGPRIADVLQQHTSRSRLDCFVRLVAAAPCGLQELVRHLVHMVPLQAAYPLVESIVSFDRVACRTPLAAFQALSDISPRVVLCGRAGTIASPAFSTKQQSIDAAGTSPLSTLMFGQRASTGPTFSIPQSRPSTAPGRPTAASAASAPASNTSVASGPTAAAASVVVPAVAGLRAKDCCMRGHLFRETSSYPMECHCNACGARILSGFGCRICNFDLCRPCHAGYKGNSVLLQMMQTPSTMPRNRASLVCCIGDIERYFRTGSTTTKSTQLAPTSQSSLQNIDRFALKAEFLLNRKVTDGGESRAVVEVAQLLLAHPLLLRTTLYRLLQTFYTRGVLAGDPNGPTTADNSAAATPVKAPAASASAGPVPALTEAQTEIAARLAAEALEDRYILYRPTVGRCGYQDTLLSVMYEQAYALGNAQVLFQLENCLLRQEGSNEPITRPPSAPNSSHDGSVTSKGRPTAPLCLNAGSDAGDPEYGGDCVTALQSYTFHHFETDSASRCSCGKHGREEFATKHVSEMTMSLPDLARRADVLLLILLHRTFYSPMHAVPGVSAMDPKSLDAAILVNSAVTTSVVKALEASALRVAVLPMHLAVPRWVSFVLTEARFLVSVSARQRIARYLGYGARRSFITYMRTFRQYRLDRTVAISPGEWARMSNHKFTVNRANFLRDAYTVLRKSADARLPISIEFVGDVGVGQGPTAQFYTLLAQELSKASLALWRNTAAAPATTTTTKRTSSSSPAIHHHVPAMSQHPTTISGVGAAASEALVNAPPEGLYPARSKKDRATLSTKTAGSKSSSATPTASLTKRERSTGASSGPTSAPVTAASPTTTRASIRDGNLVELTNPRAGLQDYVQAQRDRAMAFYTAGAALGRAFLDEQVLPLPLSSALAVVLRCGVPPFRQYVAASSRQAREAEVPLDLLEVPPRMAGLVDRSVAKSLEALAKLGEETLKSLELPFTLPGDDEFELIPGGAKVFVTANNLKRYQRRVASALLYDSVAFPMRMLTMGCNDVIPRGALDVLEVGELMQMLCGEERSAGDPLWTAVEIRSVLVGDHGYQNDSPQLEMLGSILAKRLKPQDQRAFLLFVTGCPRLPVGGIRALGAITVVKRSNAFAHARGMAAAQERDLQGGGGGEDDDDDDEDNEDGENPIFAPPGTEGMMRSDMDGASSNGNREQSPVPTNSSLTRATVVGGDGGSIIFELPDSEWALPSVNTCFRYLKLPPYPSEELMFKKLLISITQCGDTFELS